MTLQRLVDGSGSLSSPGHLTDVRTAVERARERHEMVVREQIEQRAAEVEMAR